MEMKNVILSKRIKKLSKLREITHLSWPSGIGLGSGSVLLLKVSGLILSSANLRGLV